MATTYFAALSAIVEFAVANGYDNQEVIDKVCKLRDQKATKAKSGQKSAARKANETLAVAVADAIRNSGEPEVKAAWIRDHVDGINTTPKAVAVINVGVDMGILKSRRVQKSATRFELAYSVAE